MTNVGIMETIKIFHKKNKKNKKIICFLGIVLFLMLFLGLSASVEAIPLVKALAERKRAFDLAPTFWQQVEFGLDEKYNTSLDSVLTLYKNKIRNDKNLKYNPFMYIALSHIYILKGNQGRAEEFANYAITI